MTSSNVAVEVLCVELDAIDFAVMVPCTQTTFKHTFKSPIIMINRAHHPLKILGVAEEASEISLKIGHEMALVTFQKVNSTFENICDCRFIISSDWKTGLSLLSGIVSRAASLDCKMAPLPVISADVIEEGRRMLWASSVSSSQCELWALKVLELL